MPAPTEIASAYLALVPSMRNFARDATQQLLREMNGSGDPVGRAVGQEISSSAGQAIRRDLPREVAGATRAAARDAEREAGQAGDRAGRGFGSKFKGAAGNFMAGLAGGLVAGIGVDMFSGLIADAEESAKVTAKTEAIIKATGGTAKISAGQVGDLASAISQKTAADDEAVQSGANMLLTFKNVANQVGEGNDVFNRATAAAVDLSSAGFGSIEGASVMLGKALNDPIKGMSALGRAGVTFTEEQKATVKALMEGGAKHAAMSMGLVGSSEEWRDALKSVKGDQMALVRTMESKMTPAQRNQFRYLMEGNNALDAQKIILKEVEGQVGGTAAASATAGERMTVAWGNFREELGAYLIPLFERFVNFATTTALPMLSGFLGFVQRNSTALMVLGGALAAVALVYGTVTGAVAAYGAATAFVSNVQAVWAARTRVMAAAQAALGAATAFVSNVQAVWAARTRVMAAAQAALNVVLSANPIGLVVIAIAGFVAALVILYKRNESVRRAVQSFCSGALKAWDGLRAGLGRTVAWITENGAGAFPKFKTGMRVLRDFWGSRVTELRNAADRVSSGFSSAINKVTGPGGVFSRFKTGMSAIRDYWSRRVDEMRATAERIRSVFTAPIRYVVNSLIRDKLVAAWNRVAGRLNLPTWDFKGFATGGFTGPGRKYDPAGIVHAGEYVIRKESVDRIRRKHGLSALDYMNTTGRVPGFAGGGYVYQSMAGWLRKAMPWALITSSLRPGARTVTGNKSYHSAGKALDLVGSRGHSMGELFTRLRAAWPGSAEIIHSPAGNAQVKNGRPHFYTGRTRAMHFNHVHWAMRAFDSRYAKAGEGFSIGNPVAAGLKKLVSIPISLAKRLADTVMGLFPGNQFAPLAGGVAKDALGHTQKWLDTRIDKIFPPLFGDPSAGPEDASKEFAGGGLVRRQTLDSGGLLQPGLTLVKNGLGAPETVRTPNQEAALQRRLNGGRGDGTTVNIYGIDYDTTGEVANELLYALDRVGGRSRYVR